MMVAFIIAVFVIIVICSIFFGHFEISPSDLPDFIADNVMLSFLKKREKISVYKQLAFLKKKLKKEIYRKYFFECVVDCDMEQKGKIHAGKLYGADQHLCKEFQEFWSLADNMDFFSEKENEWIGKIEKEAKEKIKKYEKGNNW